MRAHTSGLTVGLALALGAGGIGCDPVIAGPGAPGSECTGPWQTPVILPAGHAINGLLVADVTGDSQPDIVTAEMDNHVGVFVNLGYGLFAEPTHYPAGDTPSTVAAADFRGDGRPSLVVANFYSNKATLLSNQGGMFVPAGDILVDPSPKAAPSRVVASDVNGDGKLDLVFAVVTVDGSRIDVLMNNGDDSFAAPAAYPDGKTAYEVVARDLNGDGKPDLVATDFDGDVVQVFPNKGDGTFAAPAAYATGHQPQSLAVADLNGDGRPDLVVSNVQSDPSSDVSVFLQQDGGAFAQAAGYPAGGANRGVAVADLDADGLPDIAVARNTVKANDLAILRGREKGTFGPPVYTTLAHDALAVAAADLDADGLLDLTVASDPGDVSILLRCPSSK
jgi:hypothetical protein